MLHSNKMTKNNYVAKSLLVQFETVNATESDALLKFLEGKDLFNLYPDAVIPISANVYNHEMRSSNYMLMYNTVVCIDLMLIPASELDKVLKNISKSIEKSLHLFLKQ